MTEYQGIIERVRAEAWAKELRRLAGCADIPRYRRKQLLCLAEEMVPDGFPAPHDAPDIFSDGYYRRPGLRMKLTRSEDAPPPPAPLRLLALQSQEPK